MTPEEIKRELNDQYSGQTLTPSLIIDIVVDAAEMMKREDLRPRITERKTFAIPKNEQILENAMVKFLEKCRTCKANPQVIEGSLNKFWCTTGKMYFENGSAYVLGTLECHDYSERS